MASDDGLLSIAVFAAVGYGVWQFLRQRNVRPGQLYFAPHAPSDFAFRQAAKQAGGGLAAMQVSANGIAFIKQIEGLNLNRYIDAGHPAIGYGHDIVAGENIPNRITQAQANTLLSMDLEGVESTLNGSVAVPLTQNQFDALASFVYNVGAHAFTTSTLLKMLNAGNYAGAAAQLMRWVHSEGKVNAGLENRRRQEQQLFNSGSGITS